MKVQAIRRAKRSDVDMTTGGIAGNIIRFALPLLLGNLFQQLYNMVDTWVIGQTGQNEAYAAVGSVGPIINILIGFFLGLSSGAGVVISQHYGARNYGKVQDAVHTSIAVTLIMGVVFTLLGLSITPLMLRFVFNTGDAVEVYPYARTYLLIYFSGVIGLMVYNMGAGILRAVGDSRRPFYFLVVSALLNIGLDLLFVFTLEMGVAGVALATVISQCVSALLTLIVLLRSDNCVKLTLRKLRIDREILKKIFKVGIPAALQMAITAFSNVFVQGYIAGVNSDQTACLGGWTTYGKIDQFIFMPLQSLALAATTFVGQNLGVGDIPRAKRGTHLAYGMATASALLLMGPVMLFAPELARIFNPDPQVVRYATMLLRTLTPFYLFCCVNQVFSGALRGAGNARAPMFIMLGSFVVFRQIYLFVITHYVANEILWVAMSYPAGWGMCATLTLIYYHRCRFDQKLV